MGRKKSYSETVILAFLKHDKLADIAREIGVTPQTAAKYRDDSELQELLSERRMQYVKEAVAKMQGFMTEGVEILQNIIRDNKVSPQTRVNAVQIMFNQCKMWTETTDILERLKALEDAENNEK